MRLYEKLFYGTGLITGIAVVLWMLIASLEHEGMFVYYYEPNALVYGAEVFLFVIGIVTLFKFFVDVVIRNKTTRRKT